MKIYSKICVVIKLVGGPEPDLGLYHMHCMLVSTFFQCKDSNAVDSISEV